MENTSNMSTVGIINFAEGLRDMAEDVLGMIYIVRPIYAIIMAMVIILNTMTIIVLVKTKNLRRIPSNLFILTMSVIDLTMGIAMVYYNLPSCIGITNKGWLCVVPMFVLQTTPLATVIVLFLIGVDRLLAVSRSIQYKTVVTNRRVVCVCVFVILFQLLHPGGYYFYFGYKNVIMVPKSGFIYMFPVWVVMTFVVGEVTLFQTLTTILYVIIIYKLKKNVQASSAMGSHSAVNKRTARAIKTMATVLFFLFATWCPYTIWMCYAITTETQIGMVETYEHIFIIISFVHANSFVNPLIYCWHNKEFREAYKRIMRCPSRSVNTGGSVDS